MPAPDPSHLIEFQDVWKAFGPKEVYKGLNLFVSRGETLTIMGGSGVGKSVMLKLLIGLLQPDKGEVYFDNQLVNHMTRDQLAKLRQRVGMVFQGAALFDSLSVADNVAYGLREHFMDTMSPNDIGERVSWALASVGMPGIENLKPSELSGGMRKRVGAARTIALRPEVILYDEPTTGLDPINTERINHLIIRLKNQLKITSIVVTHDMGTAFKVSDRMAMVYKGQIIASGTKDEMRANQNPVVKDFINGVAPEDEDVETLLQQ